MSTALLPEQLKAAERLGLGPEDLEELRALVNDRYGVAMPKLLRVRDKDRNELVGLSPTAVHLKFVRNRRKYNYVVKPRQVWFTTFCQGDVYLDCVEGSGVKAMFINLDAAKTEEVFDRVHTFHREFPVKAMLPRQARENTRKLSWMNGASFDAATCNNDGGAEEAKTMGRSCTVQRVHTTECSFMRHWRDFLDGLRGSLAPNGRAVFESTGNGAQGGFWEDCMEIYENGEQIEPGVWVLGEKMLQFVQWWEHPEYTLDKDPLPLYADKMDLKLKSRLEETLAEHRGQMDLDKDLTEEFKERALWWRVRELMSRGFLRDADQAIGIVDQEYPGTISHAFQSTGSAYFNLGLVDERAELAKRISREKKLPIECRIVELKGEYLLFPGDGPFLIWSPPYDPAEEDWENRYCIGGDVAGGNRDSDFDCIFVKDRLTNLYAACVHGRFGPQRFAEYARLLGNLYHKAKISFEANNHGVGVQIKLHEWQYPHLFYHNDKAEHYTGLGFRTDETSREKALAFLKSTWENRLAYPQIFYAPVFDEMRTFRSPPGRTPSGKERKPQAAPGKHDDLITGLWVTEACDVSMAPVRKLETPVVYSPSQVGYMKQLAMQPPAGHLRNVL